VAGTLPRIVKNIEGLYLGILRRHGERAPGGGSSTTSKVTDHHAIIPTVTPREGPSLGGGRKDLRSGLPASPQAWQDDHIWSVTTVITAITNGDLTDRYHSAGTAVQQPAGRCWISPLRRRRSGVREAARKSGGSRPCRRVWRRTAAGGDRCQRLEKEDSAPSRFTEGTLLTAMETAGKTLDEKELSEAMKETGLGTPATRAAIIEVLLKRD